MKSIGRRTIPAIILLGAILPACRGRQDRQMVYTAPRVAPAPVEGPVRRKPRWPSAAAKAPAGPQIPESAGVDVPIIEPP